MLSLATHGVLLGALGLLTFASLGDSPLMLLAEVRDSELIHDVVDDVTLADFTASDAASDAASVELASLDLSAEASLESALAPHELTPLADLGDALAVFDSAALLSEVVGDATGSDQGDGTAGSPAGRPSRGKVSFFGLRSDADRVAFVVDNSGTMQQGRMETTLLELDAAVRRLSSSQEFYVVFYSDQAYPMFYPESPTGPLAATHANFDRLTAWLRTVEICLGGRLLDAIELAASVEPDVVFLLSDGDIRSQRVMARLTEPSAWPFTIHTLGMGARTAEHAANLQAIARSSGGGYRPVAAHPQAVLASRRRPIRYHRTPGPVWGSQVQPWD